jgi:hypothetical protein
MNSSSLVVTNFDLIRFRNPTLFRDQRKRWKDTQTKPEGTAAGCGILFRLRTKQAVEVHWQ